MVSQTTLDAKQEVAILALLNEPNIKRAAEAAGIGERTLHRWLDDAEFMAAYRRARRQAFGQAIAMTQKYAPVAVQTLAKVATDPTSPHAAKVSAATALLKFSREAIELDDLAARLEALESVTEKPEQEGSWPRSREG